MPILDGSLNQTATYWAPSSAKDRYGRLTYSSPVTLKVRWEDRNELFLDTDGNERRSVSRVYTRYGVEEGGYLYLGTSTQSDPTNQSGALQIRAIRYSPSLANDDYVRRAVL